MSAAHGGDPAGRGHRVAGPPLPVARVCTTPRSPPSGSTGSTSPSRCADGQVPAALAGARALGLGGLSVTMPHKEAVAAACDRLTDEAAALGAVNCVVPDGDRLVGHNTDGAGFVAALAADGIDRRRSALRGARRRRSGPGRRAGRRRGRARRRSPS